MTDTTERSCKRCGEGFKRWDSYAHPGSAATHCNPCYLVKSRERQTPDPSKRRGPRPIDGPKKVYNDQRYKSLRVQVLAEESLCGFCGELVDKTLKHTDRRSATIDHIVPLVLGGDPFDRSNVRLAHRSCNAAGGNAAKEDAVKERLALARAALWIGSRLAA